MQIKHQLPSLAVALKPELLFNSRPTKDDRLVTVLGFIQHGNVPSAVVVHASGRCESLALVALVLVTQDEADAYIAAPTQDPDRALQVAKRGPLGL